MTAAWIWSYPDEDQVPVFVEYDDKVSGLVGSKVLDSEPLSPDAGKAIFATKEYSGREVSSLHCLPTTMSTPVIDGKLAGVVGQFSGPDEVQVYPVEVRTEDAILRDYSFIIPLNRVTCTDIKKSDITGWVIPGKYAYAYKSLRFFDGCLGSLAIARDDVTNLVVVSDALRTALLNSGDKGLAFTLPEETRTLL